MEDQRRRSTQAVSGYATYVDQNVADLVSSTQTMCAAINAGNLTQAEIDYPQARIYYERIEPVAEVWGTLDTDIDGRIDNPVTNPADLEGFHRIEKLMWANDTLDRGRRPFCSQLVNTSSSSDPGGDRLLQPGRPWPAAPPT